MSWSGLASWWIDEIRDDPAYEQVVTPLLLEVLKPELGCRYLDIGSGEGRVSRAVEEAGARCFGVEVDEDLAQRSSSVAVVGDASSLPVRGDHVDGVFLVLVLEHIADHVPVFKEAARVTKPGSVLALVMNHPIWTSPDSTPITDDDGEILWRPGEYFSDGSSEMPAGDLLVTFHHRTMGELLSAAASAGWSLDLMIEQPHHELEAQGGIPRLLACRWSLLP